MIDRARTPPPGGAWRLERDQSTAADFHGRPLPDPAAPAVWWHEVTAPALVLGSTQRDDVVDRDACRRAGVDVVRRRSGGGAVLLLPGEVTWCDVIVPRDGPGWSDDVHVPMRWLGAHLAEAFAAVGVADPVVHTGPMDRTPASAVVCFDGLAPGESTVDGAKFVGISQRRTRHAARLQACWYHRHDHADLLGLLAPEVRPEAASLRPVATAPASSSAGVIGALVGALGRPDG